MALLLVLLPVDLVLPHGSKLSSPLGLNPACKQFPRCSFAVLRPLPRIAIGPCHLKFAVSGGRLHFVHHKTIQVPTDTCAGNSCTLIATMGLLATAAIR